MRPPSGTTLCLCFGIQLVFSYYTKNDFDRNKDNFYSSYNELSGADQNHKLKLRHQSRFHNLDRIKSKLDSLSTDGRARYRPYGWSIRGTTTTTTTQAPEYVELFSENGDTDYYDDNFDQGEDDDEVNYFDDEDDNDKDDDDNKDDSDDDFFNEFEEDREIQDEGSKFTVQSVNQKSDLPKSDFTQYKWAYFGTQNAVQETRRQMASFKSGSRSNSEDKTKAVLDHYNYMKNITQCSIPKPKVIPVQQLHPNDSLTYTPHCTLLYRCAEDTGCCPQDKICQYKFRDEVHLYVYTKLIGSGKLKAEKLLFYNDTDCECQPKNQTLPSVTQVTNKGRREITTKSGASFLEKGSIRCNCPEEFTPKIKYSSKCFCGCAPENEDCIRMKKGKEYLSLKDRLCLSNNKCGTIECEYGQYIKHKGRCPRRNEKDR